MASVLYVTSCCLGNQSILINSDLTNGSGLLEEEVVCVICLIVSIASFIATLTLLYPWRLAASESSVGRQGNVIQSNGVNRTARCLISAGMLANLGLIVRCSVWLGKYYPPPDDQSDADGRHVFCIASTIWVQYFFLCVIFWHLVYGLETFMASLHKSCSLCTKYFMGWIMPAALSALVSVLAYYPSVKSCGAKKRINQAIVSLLYLLPVVVVVLLMAVLFYKSLNNVRRSLIRHFGRFSTMERQTVDNISVKFIIITVSYIVCWIPNLVNGIIINMNDVRGYSDAILIFLVLESVLNPFQIFIDSMVMFGWPPAGCCGIFRSNLRDNSNYANINNLRRSRVSRSQATEEDPLLTFSNSYRPRN